MNKIELDKYYEDTFSLARTMIIKVEALATRDNQMLRRVGYQVSSDKRTWRYYMNLNGDYHPTDDPMYITSLDSDEEILFSKETLATNITTNKEYRKGGYWYNRLVSKFPHQTTLINGILSPIGYETTINAEDYKILSYNKNLVLWNEDQLIGKLQKFIIALSRDLFKTEYMYTDDLYLPLMVQKLYTGVVEAIHTIRLEDCFTRHTHEFFVWSHLQSHGDFEKYKRLLSREQVMWLFRNIVWLNNHPGRISTFNKLMDNILTKSRIPLAQYDMVISTDEMLERNQNFIDGNPINEDEFFMEGPYDYRAYTPTPLYRRTNLNLLEDYGSQPTYIDTESLIYKEMALAKNNRDEASTYLSDATNKGHNSLISGTPTKVLESSLTDYSNQHSDTLMGTLLNHWIYLSAKGIYDGNLAVIDPLTGGQLRLNVGDAYNLWVYLIKLSNGEDPTYICPAYYNRVLTTNPKSEEELFDLAGKKWVSRKLVNDVRSMWFGVTSFTSSEALLEHSSKVYNLMWDAKKIASQYYDLNLRARVSNLTNSLFDSGIIKVGDIDSYPELLGLYSLDLGSHSSENLVDLAWEIFKAATSWNSDAGSSLGQRQEGLIDLMLQLSSYSIQVVREIFDETNVSELINEIFVGDSEPIGGGLTSNAYLDNVQLNIQSNLKILSGNIADVTISPMTFIDSSFKLNSCLELRDNSTITSSNFKPDIRDYAVNFPNNSYSYMTVEGVELTKYLIKAKDIGRVNCV